MRKARLTITADVRDNLHILRLSGGLDTLDSIQIPARMQPYTRKHFGIVVLDLSGTGFVDSQWLAVFIRFDELCRRSKNTLFFLIPPGTIRDLMVTVGLHRVFTIVDSLDDIHAHAAAALP